MNFLCEDCIHKEICMHIPEVLGVQRSYQYNLKNMFNEFRGRLDFLSFDVAMRMSCKYKNQKGGVE